MGNIALDMETAFIIDLKNIYEGTYFEIRLERYQDDQTTPENWDTGTYQMNVSQYKTLNKKLITLTQQAGDISVVGNVMTIKCSADKNKMVSGKTYYYDIIIDKGAGKINVMTKGTLTVVNYSISR